MFFFYQGSLWKRDCDEVHNQSYNKRDIFYGCEWKAVSQTGEEHQENMAIQSKIIFKERKNFLPNRKAYGNV